MDVCRACLMTENYLDPLDEISINNYNLLTNLHIALSDGMPQYLCQNCGQLVKLFIEFRDKALSSERTLRKFAEEGKPDVWLVYSDGNICAKNEDKEKILEIKQEIHENEDKIDVLSQEVKLEISYDENEEESNITYSLNAFNADNFRFCESDGIEVKNIKNLRRKRKINKKDSKVTVHGKQSLQSCEQNNKKRRRSEIIKKESEITIPEYDKQSLLSCGLCKKKFDCKSKLVTHLDGHKKDGISECGLCGELCSTWPELLSHRITHIPSKEHCCHTCGKRYASAVYLEFHYITSHYEGHDKKIKCKVCNRSYDNPRKLNKHKWGTHAQVKYICDFCSKRFITKTVLRTHMKAHMEKKSYVCDLCGFSCKRSHSLKSHKIRRHAPDKVTCKQCTRSFSDQKHHDSHSCNLRIRICHICGKECDTSSKMSRHMRTHEDIKRFKCDRCPVTYKSRSALKIHKDRHDGNRTQQCEYCQAKFYSPSVLIKHRRVHTGEKPYVCEICRKAFTGMHNLKVHMQTHGEYTIVRRNKNLEGKEDNNPIAPLQPNPKKPRHVNTRTTKPQIAQITK